ncbi:MAG: hypothetical protein ACD_75C00391G0003 [uncultured bacterium]|nr:MAG: hypothetical protein ACD_75C00391G0003 [uncultured bacterium]
MAGIEKDLQQHIGWQRQEQVAQFVVDDDMVFVPLVAGRGQIVGAEGLINMIFFLVAVQVRHLGAVT